MMGGNKLQNLFQLTILGGLLVVLLLPASSALHCFECSSVDDHYCPDTMTRDDEGIIEYKECESTLYEPMHCVKATGVIGDCAVPNHISMIQFNYALKKNVAFNWKFYLCLYDIFSNSRCHKGNFVSTSSLHCHVCDETKNKEGIGCSDPELLEPLKSCHDVFDAQYCVKTEGVWGGSLGTRRFCSSRDMGNYCDYIKRPGDHLEYRSCVYTCSGNGCNGANSQKLQISVFSTFTIVLFWVMVL